VWAFEYKAGDGANALTVDSLAWEFLAAAARMRREKCTKPPAWWRRIVDLLHSESARDLRVADLAREASVHPVHLARVFRRLTNQTPGEWRCSSFAFTLLQGVKRGTQDIAAAAAELGLADQSHLTRMLKRHTSYTPGLFRDTFGRSLGEPPLVRALGWSLARAKRLFSLAKHGRRRRYTASNRLP
jgi:AraC family transcriptional regulator